MNVRYTVTLDDFVALNLYLTRKSGGDRPGFLMAWIGLPALGAVGAVRFWQLGDEVVAIWLLGMAVFWVVVIPSRYRVAQGATSGPS